MADSCPAPLIGTRWSCVYDEISFGGTRLQFTDAGPYQDLHYYGGNEWDTNSWSNTRGQRAWLNEFASHSDSGLSLCMTGNAHAGNVASNPAGTPLLQRSAAGRIVNVSSAMGSLGEWSDPESPLVKFAPVALAYNSSKTALNAITVAYAHALRGSGIRVNSADPGYVATDLNGHSGYRSVAEGAQSIVQLAMLTDGGPTGSFLSDSGPVPW